MCRIHPFRKNFVFCFVRAGEDSTTLRRQMAVYQAVRDINRTYFKRSDVKMKMGEYSSWLEVHFDPHKQNVRSGAPPMRNNNQQGPKPPMNQMPPQQPQQKPLQVNPTLPPSPIFFTAARLFEGRS